MFFAGKVYREVNLRLTEMLRLQAKPAMGYRILSSRLCWVLFERLTLFQNHPRSPRHPVTFSDDD